MRNGHRSRRQSISLAVTPGTMVLVKACEQARMENHTMATAAASAPIAESPIKSPIKLAHVVFRTSRFAAMVA